MKHLFIILLALLSVWSAGVYYFNTSHESDVPVLYWVTDRNPVRDEQVQRFKEWMRDNGHPEVDLHLDTSNADISKKIIQGVSGVGADLMDIPSDQLSFFVRMGLLADLTDVATELGFDMSKTYGSLADVLFVDGHQYAFPANTNINGLIVNVDQFERLGIEVPQGDWSVEAFEAQGQAYVMKANQGLARQLYFFCGPIIDRGALMRSFGQDMFNETLTAPTIDSPQFIDTLTVLKRWIDLGIMPSAADVQSMATDSGYGGASFQLFNNGNFAMIQVGRYAIILLRQVGSGALSVAPAPNGGFPNATISTRAVGVYKGSHHADLAPYFLAYLASDLYNETVVESGDALPPDPAITQTEAYTKPAQYPNEHDFHKHYAHFAADIAIPQTISPYVLPSVVARIERDAHDAVMANMHTPERAAADAQQRVENEIRLTLREHTALREDYAQWEEKQKEIDRLKAEGHKIPASLIRNPFHRTYYRQLGRLEEPASKAPVVAEAARPSAPARN